MINARQRMIELLHIIKNITWSVNEFSDGMRPTIWESFITATTNSSCGLAGRLLLQDELFTYYWQTTQIYMVTANHAVHFMVHSISGSVTWALSAAIRIHHPKNFDSELQIINDGLVLLPVLFSDRGDKLLE